MKKGSYKKFNKFCGIGKVESPDGEELYVVYQSFFDFALHDLGQAIGKGKTEKKAMQDAIKNLNMLLRKVDKKLEHFEHSMTGFCFHKILDKKPIVKMEYEDEFVNADVMIDPEGECFVGVC